MNWRYQYFYYYYFNTNSCYVNIVIFGNIVIFSLEGTVWCLAALVMTYKNLLIGNGNNAKLSLLVLVMAISKWYQVTSTFCTNHLSKTTRRHSDSFGAYWASTLSSNEGCSPSLSPMLLQYSQYSVKYLWKSAGSGLLSSIFVNS